MGKKGGQKQLNFIHVAAARTENIHILQALLWCMLWWPFGLRRQGCSGETSDGCVLLHQGLRGNIQLLCTPPKKKKILPKKPFASTELNAAIETVTRKITPTIRCQQKQSQVYACQTSSLQISLLFVPSIHRVPSLYLPTVPFSQSDS